MRRWAFVFTMMGFFILLGVLLFTNPKKINSEKDLESLFDNQRVTFTSKVVNEKQIQKVNLITFENKIKAVCECPTGLKGKNIFVEGIIESYNTEKQVKINKYSKE